MISLSPLLLSCAHALLASGGPEAFRSVDGASRVLGPIGAPYEFLFLCLFDDPEGPASVRAAPDGFAAIADLSADLGTSCLLVERRSRRDSEPPPY